MLGELLVVGMLAVVPDSLTWEMPVTVGPNHELVVTNACDSLADPGDDSLSIVIEQLRHDQYEWQPLDSLKGAPPGARMVYPLDIAGCRPCAYRLWTVDEAGNRCKCPPTTNRWDAGAPVGVGDRLTFQLGRVTPMPVRRLAVVEYELAIAGDVELELYDLAGRRVSVVASGGQSAGRHLALLDAGAVPTGLYFLRLRSGDRQALRRIVVTR